MGDTTIQSGSSTSSVPPAETGEAPEDTGQESAQQTTEGTASEEGQTTPVADEGTGEAPAEEAPSSAEETLSWTADSSFSESATTTVAEESSTTPSAETQSTSDWFNQQVEAAKNGDPEAIAKLEQFTQAQVQETEPLAEQMQSRDQSADEEGDARQKKYYDEAVYKRDLNALLAKSAQEKAKLLPKDSPLRESLNKQAGQLQAANKNLNRQIKIYDARLQYIKSSDAKKQLDAQIFKLKTPVSPEEYLTSLPKSGPAMKVGSGGLVKTADGKPVDPSKQVKAEAKKAAAEAKAPMTTAQAKKAKEAPKGEEVPTVSTPTDEDVQTARNAVIAHVGKEKAEERKKQAAERQAWMAWSKGAKGKLGSGSASGEAAIYRGFMGAAFGELEKGVGGMVAGLKFLTEKSEEGFEKLKEGATAGVKAAVSGVQTAVQKTATVFSGTLEDVKKGMSALLKTKQEFTGDFERDKAGGIFGFFNHWKPDRNRVSALKITHGDNEVV